MINYGIQNQHIQEVIEKRGVFSKNMITYYPIGFDKDIYYTNEVLRKVLRDPCYSWANPFCTSRNSFDQPQYYRKQTFPFMLIGKKSDKINRWQYSGISGNPAQNSLSNTALSKKQGGFWCNGQTIALMDFPFKKLAFTNLWIVIDNPQQLQLRDLVQTIEFDIGGIRQQNYCCYDLENQINILSYIFGVDGIKYELDRIYVPLVVPFNILVLNGTYHEAIIRCMSGSGTQNASTTKPDGFGDTGMKIGDEVGDFLNGTSSKMCLKKTIQFLNQSCFRT